jgi:lysophospholipase L1-like esterase
MPTMPPLSPALWYDSRQGLYKDTGLTTPATLAGDLIAGWQDFSGGAKHATQATSANRPQLQFDPSSNPVVWFDPTGPDRLSNSLFTSASDSLSIYMVHRSNGGCVWDSGTHAQGMILSDGTVGTTYFEGIDNPNSGAWMPGQCQDVITGVVASSANTLFYRDSISRTKILPAHYANTGFTLGDYTGAGNALTNLRQNAAVGAPAWIKAIVVYNAVHTPTQAAQVIAALKTDWGIPARTRQIVCDGDSLTYGYNSTDTFYGATLLNSYPYQMATDNPGWMIFNNGIASETLATMNTNAAANVDAFYDATTYAKNHVVIWGGTNDLVLNGDSAATLEGRITTYVNARHAVGWKVVIVPIMDRTGFTAQNRTDAGTVNTWIAAGSSGADAVVTLPSQLAGTSPWTGNPTYWDTDHTHLSVSGYTAIKAAIEAALSPAVTASATGLFLRRVIRK